MKLLIAGLVLSAASPVLAQTIAGRAEVTDGDSLTVAGVSIRLQGIDAPEGRQICRRGGADWACGEEAATRLSGFIGGRPVRCEPRDTDQYGRTVATCFAGSLDLAGAMAEAGWAIALPQFSDAYLGDEARARSNRWGIWSSEFVAPAEWRAAQREPASEQPRAPTPARQAAQSAAPRAAVSSRAIATGAATGSITCPACPITSRPGQKNGFAPRRRLQGIGGR